MRRTVHRALKVIQNRQRILQPRPYWDPSSVCYKYLSNTVSQAQKSGFQTDFPVAPFWFYLLRKRWWLLKKAKLSSFSMKYNSSISYSTLKKNLIWKLYYSSTPIFSRKPHVCAQNRLEITAFRRWQIHRENPRKTPTNHNFV